MPKRPSDEDLRIIMEMFESSVDGNLYDPEKFGSYYKPYGLDLGNTKSTPKTVATTKVAETTTAPVQETAPAQAPAPKAEVKAEPVMAEATTAPANASANNGSTDAADILAMIRNRKSD